MTESEAEGAFESIKVWKRHGERAPHKPLLILLALAHYANGGGRLIAYREVEPILNRLLLEFGPARRTQHPELPFWHLQTDSLWTVVADGELQPRVGSSNPTRRTLLESHARGGFPQSLYDVIVQANPELTSRIAQKILDSHFPSTIHEDILAAVGLDLDVSARRRRDPAFRLHVLQAYEYRCAVCGFDIRVAHASLGLEAAHIRWHQAGGPSTVDNGLALCVLHHKLFDLGTFTIDSDQVVLVSELVHGGDRFREYLLSFHGRRLHAPQRADYYPAAVHVAWHQSQVFKGSPRYHAA